MSLLKLSSQLYQFIRYLQHYHINERNKRCTTTSAIVVVKVR